MRWYSLNAAILPSTAVCRSRSSHRISHASATTKWSILLPIIIMKTNEQKKKICWTRTLTIIPRETAFFCFSIGSTVVQSLVSLNSVWTKIERKKKMCCELLQWLYLQWTESAPKRYKTKHQHKWPMPNVAQIQTQIISRDVLFVDSFQSFFSIRIKKKNKWIYFFLWCAFSDRKQKIQRQLSGFDLIKSSFVRSFVRCIESIVYAPPLSNSLW